MCFTFHIRNDPRLSLEKTIHRVDNVVDLWKSPSFQVSSVWKWNIPSGDSLNWSIQVIEQGFEGKSADLSSDTVLWVPVFYGNKSVSLLNRFDDGGSVHWSDGSQIDHFTANSLGGELFSSLERFTNHFGVGNDGNISSFSHDFSFSNWLCPIWVHNAIINSELLSVHQLVFQENNWVWVSDGTLRGLKSSLEQ